MDIKIVELNSIYALVIPKSNDDIAKKNKKGCLNDLKEDAFVELGKIVPAEKVKYKTGASLEPTATLYEFGFGFDDETFIQSLPKIPEGIFKRIYERGIWVVLSLKDHHDMQEGWKFIMDWTIKNGYAPNFERGDPYELYKSGEEVEIRMPIKKA
ncbi:hypothetical protein HK099_006319 [Clydaea vesicula]|uniref:Uncharacterized protein n=1 Tax=Clydaea vesicula TaxID=447962 RepID=A0AAD5TY20_9FUNG|nr:hypothetical protein HK099_006319 [Clydaea vesicula]KAJ3379709.1 hypothetical protein HDU92_006514 [Lobulomyces angularis]